MGLGGLLVPLLFLGVAGSRLQIFTDPSSRALLGSGALLKCRFEVGGPVDLSSLRVQWYLFEERIAQYDQGRGESQVRASVLEQELKTGDASLLLSSVTVSDEGPYKCIVGYGTEQLQGETTLRVLAAPRLSIPQRSAVTDTVTSFPCHVWGFYPGDVTVTWLRDGRVLTDATRSAPQRNPDGTFNLTLTYTFTPSASDSGSIFSCRVTHAALAQPLREEFPLDVTGEGVLGSQLDVMGCRGHSVESDTGPQQRPMLVH
ncbi:tapasin-related protein-like [Malaclemys terrapin pileata]|uniref:tapasin-related protein-like n=1 Tax=Malaclemys terrapin pileata TaxID=2991368 RepID=UPI0023A841B5|nr:tapasin-related protein-like [Malaclemys terrapin pileata]